MQSIKPEQIYLMPTSVIKTSPTTQWLIRSRLREVLLYLEIFVFPFQRKMTRKMTKKQHLVVITIHQETKDIKRHLREGGKTGTRIGETTKVITSITPRRVETEKTVTELLTTLTFRNHRGSRTNNISTNATTRTSPGPTVGATTIPTLTVTTRTRDITIGTLVIQIMICSLEEINLHHSAIRSLLTITAEITAVSVVQLSMNNNI